MIRNRFRAIQPAERSTFKLHLAYSFIEGILAGLIALNEFVFVKSLHGSSYQLGFLFQFTVVVFLLLIFFNEFLKRVKNKKGLLRRIAIITRLPLALLFFFPRSHEQLTGDSIYHYIFLGIFLIYYLANPIIFPTINLFLKNAYRHENFGRYYSYSTTVNKVVMMVTTFAYGWALDLNHYVFVYIFPVAAILGMLSVFLLSRIPYGNTVQEMPRQTLWEGIKHSVREMKDILIRNLPFRHFEVGFMFYGFGFMSSSMVIVLFLSEGLMLNYSSVAFYRNAYNLLAILILPFFGRLIGRIDPRRFAAISFFSMVLFIFALVITRADGNQQVFFGITLYHTLLLYILFHGVFAATMGLTWSIGSAYFCEPSEAGTYQAIHLGLTAVRSLFAPLLGILFYETWGFDRTFMIAMASLMTGVIIMLWSEKKFPLNRL
ncbi:MAG: MFS transporter [Bacteroides sp.]|jgi:Na+/melibiose symporter-like transporter|nr:MFS transporter [Bacteroides sp.]